MSKRKRKQKKKGRKAKQRDSSTTKRRSGKKEATARSVAGSQQRIAAGKPKAETRTTRPFTHILYFLTPGDKSLRKDPLLIVGGYRPNPAKARFEKAPLRYRDVRELEDGVDKETLVYLAGMADPFLPNPVFADGFERQEFPDHFPISKAKQEKLFPDLLLTGRCRIKHADEFSDPLEWRADEPWEFRVEIAESEDGSYTLTGLLGRQDESCTLDECIEPLPSGFVIWPNHAAPLDDSGAGDLMSHLHIDGQIQFSKDEIDDTLDSLRKLLSRGRVILPDSIRFEHLTCDPQPRLILSTSPWLTDLPNVQGGLSFKYGEKIISEHDTAEFLVETEKRNLLARNRDMENEAVSLLE
ncbi:MAG: hypothetical protein QF886_24610, partial [Planctomycetota bacterium]|nr:hypothetical protein [Planctomycetota bacterium]